MVIDSSVPQYPMLTRQDVYVLKVFSRRAITHVRRLGLPCAEPRPRLPLRFQDVPS